ncbi:MAG TPA: hypothetical protein VMM13_21220, partial [Euzebya sp.]|nr:hypothetical protein [Euzebya sp.]
PQVLDRPDLLQRIMAYGTWVALGQEGGTTHADPAASFEAELAIWVRSLLDPGGGIAEQLRPLALRAGEVGMAAGLSQTLLRVATRGVPDTYQGTEHWDDSIFTGWHPRAPEGPASGPWSARASAGGDRTPAERLDADSRRAVDFDDLWATARSWTDQAPDIAALWAARRDGRVKQWVLRQSLHVRRSHPDVFGPDGGQEALDVDGRWAAHLVVLHRIGATHQAVAVCPRVLGRVTDGGRFPPVGRIWADTELALPDVAEGATWHDVLSGRAVQAAPSVPASTLLADLPVALLLAPRATPDG